VVAGITELRRAVIRHRKSGVEELGISGGLQFYRAGSSNQNVLSWTYQVN
jgi:hypothetical protein